MIRAIRIDDDMLRRSLRYMFVMESQNTGTLYYARRTDGDWQSAGWYTASDLYAEPESVTLKDGWELVIVDLDRDVAASLADAILTETTGIAPTDARALRNDLQHERARRDKVEDVLIALALRRE